MAVDIDATPDLLLLIQLYSAEVALHAVPIRGLWSKRRQVRMATGQNDDGNGYIQNGDKPKQHLQFL